MNLQSIGPLRFYAITAFALLVIAVSTRLTFAQNTFPTPSGNVGVGTTSPATLLNVNLGAGDSTFGTGAVRVGGTSNYPSLELGIKGPYDGMISTYGNDLHLYAGNWRCNGCSASENHNLWFYTSQNGSANWNTPKMVLDYSGNLGIGTTTPNSILELKASTPLLTFNAATINSFVGLNFYGAGYGTNSLASSRFNGNSGEFRHEAGYSSYGGFHTFFTNGSERLRIDSSGSVALGATPSGNFKFEVAGLGAPGTGAKIGVIALARSGSDYDSIGYNFRPTSTTGTYHYELQDRSSRIEFTLGGFTFKTAPQGSGGSAITYTDVLTILQGGNTGIGTTSPGGKLEVYGAGGQIKLSGVNTTDGFVGTSGSKLYLADWATASKGVVVDMSNGNVGLGTSNPGTKLEVGGQGRFNVGTTFSAIDTGWAAAFGYSGGNWGVRLGATGNQGVIQAAQNTTPYDLAIQPYGGNVGIGTTTPGSGYKLDVNGALNATGLNINGSPVTASQWSSGSGNINYTNGNVGIGTSSPGTKLEVGGQGRFNAGGSFSAIDAGWAAAFGYSGGNWGVRLGATGGQGVIQAAQSTTAYDLAVQPYGGNVGIGTASLTAGFRLDVSGDLKVSGTGNINANGTIEAGNIKAKYQDVAEWVESSEQLVAGTVVVLDSTKSNQVIASTVGYDTRVAGVISAQPGITLGEKGHDKVLVATTGRVKIKVDASKASIQIGDLLVTSDVPGVAMKSEAVNLGGVQFHRPGTLIGKALEPLAKGKGEILVLLSLQ